MGRIAMKYVETAINIAITRTYYYMENLGRVNSFEHFPYLAMLCGSLTEEDVKSWERNESAQAERYWKLLKSISNDTTVDQVVHTALDLCLAAACVPEFANYLNYYTGKMVNIQLAFELEGNNFPSYGEVADRLHQLEKICAVDRRKGSLSYAALEADRRLLAYLFEEEEAYNVAMREPVFESGEWFLCTESLHPMYVRKETAEECAGWIQNSGKQSVVQIAGEGGSRFLAKHIARLLGKDLFFIPIKRCMEYFDEEIEELKGNLIRELFWGSGMLCLYGITRDIHKEGQDVESVLWKHIVSPILEMDVPILFCTDERFFINDHGLSVKRVELKSLSREERQQVFEGFASLYGLAIDSAKYSVRYRLSAGEIAKAVDLWRQKGTLTDQAFSYISTQILSNKMEKTLGHISYPSARFDDLKVPEEVCKKLDDICYSVLNGYQLFEKWGLKQQYLYGKAITVMLSGPPGTGKTMTAHTIAGELGIPLYQVDLSKVLDKYIGESEKHLEEIFSFAEKTNVVLFFDEADALFGKRGKVTDGKDRYSNMEVAYILQRIENFEGIVVLSTNFYNNIDKAFLRRMKYVLKYHIPDKDIRCSIWESCLPAEEFRDFLDIIYLAEQFEFTGGMIKNVVLAACVVAMRDGNLLSMEHILQAIRAEHEKMEWPVSAETWGAYGYLMV